MAQALPPLERRGSRRFAIWTPAHDALLGLVADHHLAEAWNLLDHQVWRRRTQLRILPFGDHPPIVIHWTVAMIRELGTMTDKAFAVRHGMAKATASLKRVSLGIPKSRHPQTRVWTPAMQRLLGTQLDRDLAHRFGMCAQTVRLKRQELGIPRKVPTKVDWDSPRIRRLLGSTTDGEIARRLGVHVETVRVRRTQAGIAPYAAVTWTPAILARLGTVPDRVIAEEVGVTPSAVGWHRQRMGIRTWDVRYHGTA